MRIYTYNIWRYTERYTLTVSTRIPRATSWFTNRHMLLNLSIIKRSNVSHTLFCFFFFYFLNINNKKKLSIAVHDTVISHTYMNMWKGWVKISSNQKPIPLILDTFFSSILFLMCIFIHLNIGSVLLIITGFWNFKLFPFFDLLHPFRKRRSSFLYFRLFW